MALLEEMEAQGNFMFKYRGQLPLIIVFVGIAVFAFDKVNNPTAEVSDMTYFLALGVSLFGLLIRILTVGFTPKNTSGRNTEEQLADVLNTTGIYSTVRHPLYVGNFFMSLGIALLIENHWFTIVFTMFYWLYYERIMFAEEQFLRGKFGEKYVEWSMGRNAFVPTFKNYQKPNIPFNWKKVILKEKNGVVSMFVLLLAFATINQYVMDGTWLTEKVWIIYGTIGSIVYYLFFKILQKTTKMFDSVFQ
jgi:protein-S-isoprenylcysteine O-methyltransferase Ste14